MQVEVVKQLLAPGMQDQRKTDSAAKPAPWILAK